MKLEINKFPLFLLVGAFAIGWIAMAAGATMASEPTDQGRGSKPAAEGPSGVDEAPRPALQAGRVVHLDPATGRIVALPSAAQRAEGRAHLRSMINRSDAGLIETASPASGIMVNLQGRFRHAGVLTLNAAGEVDSQCAASLPPDHEEEGANHE